MARTDTLPHFLTDVADAIRTKAGTSEPIQASSFDTAISNIPSGGTTIPDSFDNLVSQLDDLVTLFTTDGIDLLTQNYETDTTEPITLYTPDTNFKRYCIYKNTSNQYRCVWCSDAIEADGTSIRKIYYSVKSNWILYLDNPQFAFTTGGGPGYFYFSSWYNTLDEAKQALKSNDTEYTYRNTYLGNVDLTGNPKIPYSNTMIGYIENSTTTYINSRKLSTQETIQVIQ